ncbi:hypothetical protein ACHAW5_010936 [Stephanodiscus triporus]|uniref:Glycosyltransferase family 92 protein n=1 Tax=Stephanodiscus triporus TaxID=2934178 RepID=A0ABD3QZU9_9STRA
MIVHRIKLDGLLLSIGLTLTFSTSILLIAWQERALLLARDRPPFFPPDVANGDSVDPAARNRDDDEWPPVLSAYSEPSSATDAWWHDDDGSRPRAPLPPRRTDASDLTRISFPRINYNSARATSTTICGHVPSLLPADDFGMTIRDPYLPWLHDLFVSEDGMGVDVVAQNRRRCHKGKHHADEMRFWEGQVALFQPVAIRRLTANLTDDMRLRGSRSNDDRPGADRDDVRYRLSTHEEADPDGVETRFVCRFKSLDYARRTLTYEGETLSTYPFNYEFVNWRKMKDSMVEDGKEQSYFWLSPLLFRCPIPAHLRRSATDLTMDIVPIRTPARRNDRDGFFFHEGHGGPVTFDAAKMWGKDHVLPRAEDSGRWENLPVCSLPKPPPSEIPDDDAGDVRENANAIPTTKKKKPHRLVACTWTSAIHQRRGNERRIADGKARLREWIAFNLLVGFDHVYVFDNSGANATIFRLKNEADPDFGNDTSKLDDRGRTHDDLSSVTDLFPPSLVTRIDWPATVCNNNRPAHDDPGERSSQYAAEAACRSRYGPYTDWMASMDPDEYFVPMGRHTSWKQVLDKVDREEGRKVLKFRSTRARPLLSALVMKLTKSCVAEFVLFVIIGNTLDKRRPIFDEGASECTREMAKSHNQCLAKSVNNTYLETYNCEYIKSPKPERFARAMTELAMEKQHTIGAFIRKATDNPKMERFVDELEEGVLIHAKTTVPAETFTREKLCMLNAPSNCLVGIPCPDDLAFDDALHTKNVFHDETGKYCNCWKNRRVEEFWLPRLNDAMSKIGIISE